MIAGAIAGAVDNITSVAVMIVAFTIGLMEPAGRPDIWSLELYITWATSHLSLNIIWGIMFGIVYVWLYDKIPREGIQKGIIFGLIFYYLLSGVRAASFLGSYAEYYFAKGFAGIGLFAAITYGLVLGYLYKKRLRYE